MRIALATSQSLLQLIHQSVCANLIDSHTSLQSWVDVLTVKMCCVAPVMHVALKVFH